MVVMVVTVCHVFVVYLRFSVPKVLGLPSVGLDEAGPRVTEPPSQLPRTGARVVSPQLSAPAVH